jgi:hypothetical protein
MSEAFERLNMFLFFVAFTDSIMRQQVVKAAVFLRLNHRFALPVSPRLTLLILQLSRLRTAGIQNLRAMQFTLELPASLIPSNPSLKEPGALEQILALQALVTVLLPLKGLHQLQELQVG